MRNIATGRNETKKKSNGWGKKKTLPHIQGSGGEGEPKGPQGPPENQGGGITLNLQSRRKR